MGEGEQSEEKNHRKEEPKLAKIYNQGKIK